MAVYEALSLGVRGCLHFVRARRVLIAAGAGSHAAGGHGHRAGGHGDARQALGGSREERRRARGRGHGHASLLVYSGGEQALVLGDVFAHPAQVTEPSWNIHFDADKEQAALTRAQLLDWLEADGITVAAGHLPGSGFGRVVREEGLRCWQPLEEVTGEPEAKTLLRRSRHLQGDER